MVLVSDDLGPLYRAFILMHATFGQPGGQLAEPVRISEPRVRCTAWCDKLTVTMCKPGRLLEGGA
jgi:hypothetical protein